MSLLALGARTDGFDTTLHDSVLDLRSDGVTGFMKVVTHAGGTVEVNAVVIVAAAFLAIYRGRFVRSCVVLATLWLGELLRAWINHQIARPRPPRTDWLTDVSAFSMPSGHSTNVVLGTGLLLVLLWPVVTRRVLRVVLTRSAVTLALLVGLSRIYLGVHWPTDVLAGWAFGIVVVLLGSYAAQAAERRVSRRV